MLVVSPPIFAVDTKIIPRYNFLAPLNIRKCSMLIRATNWQMPFLYRRRRFQNRNLKTLFKHYLHENEVFHRPTFYLK